MRSLALVFSSLWCGACAHSPPVDGDRPERFLSGEALFADVERYAAFGTHRTATHGDRATSRWLFDELEAAGLEAHMQPWTLRQFTSLQSELIVGEREVECFPFWYPRPTGPAPWTGALATLTADTPDGSLRGKIAYLDAAHVTRRHHSIGINAIVERAARSGAVAAVVIVPSVSGELTALNAREPHQQEPLPIPAVIVAAKDEAFLSAAAGRGETASLLVDGNEEPAATAENVIGVLRRDESRWIVVTTPSSGWFGCAGERGPGVALFLGLARWAAASDSQLSYMFIANSGHELDNIGAHHSLDRWAPRVDSVLCWLHLGASIATRDWESTGAGLKPLARVQTAGNLVGTPDLLPVLLENFAPETGYRPRSGEPIRGELRHFIAAGYRSFGIFGGHAYFHTPLDTPATTEPAFLEPIALGLLGAIKAIEQQ